MTNTFCYDLIRNTSIPHQGFHTFGRKRLYEWTFLEILQRCRQTLMNVSDPDEIWAFHIISIGNVPIATRISRWKSIIQSFDGSLRWVRLLAAFFCSVSDERDTMFNRHNMVKGWNEWINPVRSYELLRCIYPTFNKSSPVDVINIDNGEIPMMGMIWACTHDDPLRYVIYENEDQYINDGISSIFTDDYMSLPTSDTDTIGEEESVS